jgi:hypothetical protein
MAWRWNQFKLLAYVGVSLLLTEYAVLFIGPIVGRREVSTADVLMVILMITVNIALLLFLREEPSRFHLENHTVLVDFGLLAGRRRLVRLGPEAVTRVRFVPGGIRIALDSKEHSWIVWGRVREDIRKTLERDAPASPS